MAVNLYDYLKKDHIEIIELFRIILDQQIHSFYSELKEKLSKHMDYEEQYLYPLIEKFDKISNL